jgi:hypothetical protein
MPEHTVAGEAIDVYWAGLFEVVEQAIQKGKA